MAVGALVLAGPPGTAAHDDGPRYFRDLGWTTDQIQRAVALGRGWGLQAPASARVVTIEGRRCLEAGVLAFDVADEVAFDIDETVELQLLFAAPGDVEFLFAYGKNGAAPSISRHRAPRDPDSGWARASIRLNRARFAGRGDYGTDFAIASFYRDPALPRRAASRTGRGSRGPGRLQVPAALCELRIVRPLPAGAPAGPFGGVELTLVDPRTGRPTAARVGIYDRSGRMPLASGSAVPVPWFDELVRQLAVPADEFWPHRNRWAFYVDGPYRARLPPGHYRLVATKGPEYRQLVSGFRVIAGRSRRISRTFEAWTDMPARNWYSGDPHLHVRRRDRADDESVLAQVAAEDLWIGDTLEMGNLATTHFNQRWGRRGRVERAGRQLAPGQEDPRTARRGHALALNLQRPVRSSQRYFLFHETAERVRRQAGLWGYAHVQAGWFRVGRGLALDLPFGLVDFLEVLQMGRLGVRAWYQALNLGFRVAPTAGSDYPYLGLPGGVRNYVEVPGKLTPGSWHRGLRAGRTFVTNGPMLELEVDGHGMGGELRVARGSRVRVRARAALNPDLGRLRALELVVHGEVVARQRPRQGADGVGLDHTLTVDESLWLAVRTRGGRYGLSHSGPVYVVVDGERFWKRRAVPEIVAHQIALLGRLAEPVDPRLLAEPWESQEPPAAPWPRQRPLLERRAAEAAARYRMLLRRLPAR